MALFSPEIILLVVVVVLLCFTLTRKDSPSPFLRPFVGLAGVFLAGSCLFTLERSGQLFYGTYIVDAFSQGLKSLIALVYFFLYLFSDKLTAISSRKHTEYYLFLTTATLGMMLMTSAANILTLFVALELSSYSLYILSVLRADKRTVEASLKYLFIGAAASGVFIWGLSLVAGLAGSTSLVEIAKAAPALTTQPAFVVGLLFISFSFFFKLSSFPLHAWAPDVYESASTPVTAFIATASKAAAAAVVIRIFLWLGVPAFLTASLGVVAFLSMTIGNTVALVQQDVKRLLAYSSIAQAGYIFLGILAGTTEGFSSAYFYVFAYVLMNAGAFLVVVWIARDSGHDNPQISHFNGLAEKSPLLALLLLVSLLSLAGIPPLAGFTGKWILFSSAMDKGHWFLVLWGVLNSVVSLFYYLTLVKHAYLEKPDRTDTGNVPWPLRALALFLFAALIFLGIFPDGLIRFGQAAILQISAF